MAITQNGVIYYTDIISALNGKVDSVSGKGLSANDFTDAYKTKLDGIATGATKVKVDEELSSVSTNPVQNMAVTKALNASYTTLLSFKAGRGSGTYTLSMSLDSFDEMEFLAASANSGSVAQETTVLRIRRGDFYLNSPEYPWIINLNLTDVDRRIFIYILSETSIKVTCKGSAKLVRVVGIHHFS